MRHETSNESQAASPRRTEERPRERAISSDRARELRDRWDRLIGDPENPMICRGTD